MAEDLSWRVLGAVDAGMTSVIGLVVALNSDEPAVRTAVASLVTGGLLIQPGRDEVAITPSGAKMLAGPGPRTETGRFGSTTVTSVRFEVGGSTPVDDWADVGRLVSEAWTGAQTARRTEASKVRRRMRVGDVERDAALSQLSTGFGEGMLSQEELDRRTDVVLQAKTRGEIESVLSDLPGESTTTGSESHRSTLVLVVAILCVPLVVLVAMLAARG